MLDAHGAHQQPAACLTLAELYDPNLMRANLTKAHPALEKAVDAAYAQDGGSARYANDDDRVAFFVQALCGVDQLDSSCLFSKASLASSKDVLNDAVKSMFSQNKVQHAHHH